MAIRSRIEDCMFQVSAHLKKAGVDEDTQREILRPFETLKKDKRFSQEQKVAKVKGMSAEFQKRLLDAELIRALHQTKKAEIRTRLAPLSLKEKSTYIRNLLEETATYGEYSGGSTSLKIKRLTRDIVDGRLHGFWKAMVSEGLILKETPMALDVHKEMRGIASGNARAKELAADYRAAEKIILDRLKATGLPFEDRINHVYQVTSTTRVQSDYANAFKFLTENLDYARHPDGEASATVILGSLMSRDLQIDQMKTLSQSRKMHFATPEAEMEWFFRYGEGDFPTLIDRSLRSLIRDTVLMEELGPRPQALVESLTHDIKTEARKSLPPKQSRSIEAAMNRAERNMQSQTGEIYNPANQSLSNWASALRNFGVTQMLGLVPLAQISQDSLISFLGAGFHAGGFGRGLITQMRAILDVIGNAEAKAYVREHGIYNHAFQASVLQQYASQVPGHEGYILRSKGKGESSFGTSEKVRNLSQLMASTMTRWNGSQMIERGLRAASFLQVSRSLAKWSKVGFLDLPPQYQKVLKANGINSAQWKRFQRTVQIEPGTEAINYRALPPDLAEALLLFTHRETDLMVVYPSHYSRSALVFGSRAGTPSGEVSRAFTQFWSWPLEMFHGPLARSYQMGYAPLAAFGGAMIAGGMFTIQLYALAKGEPVFEWDDPHFILRAIGRSGLLHPIGDAILQTALWQHVDVPTGPAMTMPARLFQTLGVEAMNAIEQDSYARVGPFIRQFKELAIPNVWFLEGLTQQALNAALWELDPGYMVQKERRLAKRRN